MSADTIVPGAANPQALNRYSYVLGNPIRYNDPTGHMCSDPDDPSPSCDGGGSYPTNTHPLPAAPVVINNPGPLDDGQEQDDPTPTPDADGDGDTLTGAQLVGQVFTFVLIETRLLLPLDYALFDLTVSGVAACLDGILIVCVADIPLGAIDVVAADFQISLAYTIAQNVETGTHHDFEWIIIPNLLSTLPE